MRTALVTGASSGIGAATAALLRAHGYRVVEAQRRSGGLRVDLAEPGGPTLAWEGAVGRLGGAPDLVVANAGEGAVGPVGDLDATTLDRWWGLMLRGPLMLARHGARAWTADAPGHLILVGSQAGLPGRAQALNAAYSALKAGLHSLVWSLSEELQQVARVNAVVPGDVATPMAEVGVARFAACVDRHPDEVRAAVLRRAPEGRWTTPEEVAARILDLDRREATGQIEWVGVPERS